MSDTFSFISIMDFIQIVLMLVACFCCYHAGKFSGAVGMVNLMLDNKIIDEEHLDELKDKIKLEE